MVLTNTTPGVILTRIENAFQRPEQLNEERLRKIAEELAQLKQKTEAKPDSEARDSMLARIARAENLFLNPIDAPTPMQMGT